MTEVHCWQANTAFVGSKENLDLSRQSSEDCWHARQNKHTTGLVEYIVSQPELAQCKKICQYVVDIAGDLHINI